MVDNTDGLMLIILVETMVLNTSVIMVVLVMAGMEGHLNNCGLPIQGSRSKPNFEFSPPLL